MKDKVLGLLVVVALVLSVTAYFKGGTVDRVVERIVELGGSAGPEYTEKQTFLGGIEHYNSQSTTTSASAQTLQLSDIEKIDTLYITKSTVADDTITLFASSTAIGFLPKTGYRKKLCIQNATTTAGVDLILAGGTGSNLKVASSSATALGSKVIGPGHWGCLDIVRGASTETTFDLDFLLTIYK